MKSFTKFFCALALCVLGVMSANAKVEQVHATFENPSNTSAEWNATTRTFTWPQTSYNQIRNIGLPTGDITKYKKLVIDCEIVSGESFRILFYKGGSNKTLWVTQSGVTEFIIKDELEKLGDDYNEYLLDCTEICLSGSNAVAPGEVKINDVYLETYDDEGEKVYATFENPSNTSATWDATEHSFSWPQTSYNQIRNIGLPTGDISKYKKLVIDCEIVSGESFRILFYKGGSNKTLWVTQSGVTEFNIKEELEKLGDDYNEYLLDCTEICLSGSNAVAPGKVIVNSMYLETYPENETVDVPEIVYEEDPGMPEGDFVNFTEAFPNLTPRINLGEDGHPIVLGNGDVVIGQRESTTVIADLADYSKLTFVTSPNLKLEVYLNGVAEAIAVQADENGIAEVDLTQYLKQELTCICLPWDNSNKGTVWYILLTKNTAPADPLKQFKTDLQAAIDAAKLVSAVGKTEESFAALQAVIAAAETALAAEDATEESLTEAKNAVTAAVDGIDLAVGYSYLTADMFLAHQEQGGEGTATGCAFDINKSTGMPYGDGNVYWLNYADLSGFDKLVVVATAGAPRFCMNRTEDNAQATDDAATSKFIDIPGKTWATEAYETVDGNVYTIDLAKMVADRGIAYLHSIKGVGGASVTVSDMLLYKTPVADGIETVKAAQQADAIYNIAGQRVEKAQKGLYIIGGRKVIVK